jgi:hypothetical protein
MILLRPFLNVLGKHLATMLRIKALWRLHCCALSVCGFGEEGREDINIAKCM